MDVEQVALLLCLVLSAFFSTSETALTALPLTRLEALRQRSGLLTRRGLDRWAAAPQAILITILVGNNLVNVLGSALATRLTERYFASGALAWAVGGFTLVILVFGEITPKALAQLHAESIARRVAPLLYLLDIALRPVTFGLGVVTRLVARGPVPTAPVTEEDLVFMLRLAHRHDQLPREARLMMESVLRFQRAVAREVMVPRPLVATVEVNWSEEELRQAVASSPHSRFPVVDGSPDRLVGVFHTKQLMRLAPGQRWNEAVVDPVFIPEGKPLTDLIEDFRTTGQHLAIVLDEFGGLSGVVSMEDVLELLVGEIADEFDLAGGGVVETDGGWSVPGHLSLRRLELFAHRELASPDEAESVGGLVSSLVAEAAVGTVVEWDGLSLEVLAVDGGRPTRLGVRRLPPPGAGTAQAP